MAMIIEVNGHQVEVDDNFADLPAEQQQKELQHIVSALPVQETAPQQSSFGIKFAPELGAIGGGMTGLAFGPKLTHGVESLLPSEVAQKTGSAVENYISGTMEHPYAGGKDYSTAYQKAVIAGGQPVQSRGSNVPIRRGAASILNQPEPTPTPLLKRGPAVITTPASAPGRFGSGMRLGAAGSLAGQTAQDIERGDYGKAALHGLEALGAAAGQSKYRPLRVLGNVIAAKEAASGVMPYFTGKQQSQEPEQKSVLEKKADGGIIRAGLEALKKANAAGKSGARLAREAAYVHDVRPTHQFGEVPKLSIQDLQNKVLVGVPGDRSLTGHEVRNIAGVPLSSPVELHGGPRYGQRQLEMGNPNFWASQSGAASSLQNKVAKAIEETGKDPYGLYVAMAPDASNYALHHTEALLNQLNALSPGKKNIELFNKEIRQAHPAFFGLQDPEVLQQLSMNPDMRKLIAERLNKQSYFNELGLPSGEATIHAITEPALRDVATGTTGFSVGKLDPHAKLSIDTEGLHPTYNTQIPGEFKGEMIAQLPWEFYFPDVAKQIAANPKQAPHAFGTFKMGQFHQPVTQEMVDVIAPIEEQVLKGHADGGKILSAAKKLILPPAENAARTQIIGTLPTYQKAADIFKQQGATGRGIDFGAGLGEGAKALGKDFHTYEPFAQNWSPTFAKAADVPSDAYGKLTNLNVLNVVPREARDEIVQDIGRVMEPGGYGIITTRGKDVMNAKGLAGPEPMSVITSRDTYQKGFTKDELEEYMKYILGDQFDVNRLNLGPAGVLIKKKADGGLASLK